MITKVIILSISLEITSLFLGPRPRVEDVVGPGPFRGPDVYTDSSPEGRGRTT